MKTWIKDVVSFPNGCETVRFTACLVSMLMRAQGITEKNCSIYCEKQRGDCIQCGSCEALTPLQRKHEELYHLYTAVTGFGFMQMDLSDDDHMREEWNQTCNVLLRKFDWYIGFALDYAGYDSTEIIFPDASKETVLSAIRKSIGAGIPVLTLFGNKYQWVLVTGYDEDGALYGLDGSSGYWGSPTPKPSGYDENGLFIHTDWYEKGGHAFILGEKKQPTVTLQDVFCRGAQILRAMADSKYFDNSVNYLLNDEHFTSLTDEQLLTERDRIAGWIGQPIDQRAMLGYAVNHLRPDTFSRQEELALRALHSLCWASHDVLWIAWRMIGEFMQGDKAEWAKELKSKAVRRALADCAAFVRDHDLRIIEALQKGFPD